MTLLDFINSFSVDEQHKFAFECGTTIGYIRKAISNNQLFGPRLCVFFEKNSGNRVSRKELRPNDWHEIWPELIEHERIDAFSTDMRNKKTEKQEAISP